MKIGHKAPPHGGNGKLTGGNPIMRIHHKDEVSTDWTEKPVYPVRQRYESQQELNAKIYRDYIGNSWEQPTVTDGWCKENTSWYSNSRTNGYVKVCITTSTPSTFSLRPLWTMWTRMTRRTRTCATCRIEHTCTLSLVSSFDSFITPHGSSRSHLSFTPSACHPCAAFFEFLSITFYFFLLFLFLFPFLMTDDDSMTTNNLRDSANGTFVTLDDSSHFT